MDEQQAYNLIAQIVSQSSVQVKDAPQVLQAMQVLKEFIDKPQDKE